MNHPGFTVFNFMWNMEYSIGTKREKAMSTVHLLLNQKYQLEKKKKFRT